MCNKRKIIIIETQINTLKFKTIFYKNTIPLLDSYLVQLRFILKFKIIQMSLHKHWFHLISETNIINFKYNSTYQNENKLVEFLF